MNEAGTRQAGTLERAGAALQRAARLVAGLMFAGVFLVFLYKIVMRYALHEALAWGEEVSVILFIWIIFWANAFIMRDREQISFDLFYHRLPPAGRRVTAILRLVLIGAIVAAALPGALDYIGFLWRERTPVSACGSTSSIPASASSSSRSWRGRSGRSAGFSAATGASTSSRRRACPTGSGS